MSKNLPMGGEGSLFAEVNRGRLGSRFLRRIRRVLGVNMWQLWGVILAGVFALPMLGFAPAALAREGLLINVDRNELGAGDEVVVSASLPEELKSYAVLATLKYDENVFERIDDADFEIDEGRMTISYNSENNKFGIVNKSGDNSSGLFKVRLKVREDAKVGDTNIALTNVSASDGKSTEKFDMVSTEVSVTRDAQVGEPVQANTENEIVEDEEETVSTFSVRPIVWVLGILVLGLTGWLIYISFRDKKMRWGLFIIDAILITILAFLFGLSNNKQDVNRDGTRDYDDAQAIVDYLIGVENEGEENGGSGGEESGQQGAGEGSENNVNENGAVTNGTTSNGASAGGSSEFGPSDFDVNNDGNVDIEDAGGLVPEANEALKVSLFSNESGEKFVKKGDAMTLGFTAEINKKDISISRVKIGDEYHDVALEDGAYVVKMDAPTDAGEYTYDISEVELSNGEKKAVNLKLTREVLKDAPYVNRFNLDDGKKRLSFQLVDGDKAFIDGDVKVYNEASEEIASAKVGEKETTLEFSNGDDETYRVEVIGNYDLDSTRGDGENAFSGEYLHTQQFVLGGEYNFSLSELSITDALHKGEAPVISFRSSNTRNAAIKRVNIEVDGEKKDYEVTKVEGDYYEVVLTGANVESGKHVVKLNSVEMESLKTFDNGEDFTGNTLYYTVLKDKPGVEDFTVSQDAEDKTINVQFKIKDDYNLEEYDFTNMAIRALNIVLVDSTGKIVDNKEIGLEELYMNLYLGTPFEAELSYDKNYDGLYTVKVLADYTLSDAYKYTNESLAEQSVRTISKEDIEITEISIRDNNNDRKGRLNYPSKGTKDYIVDFTVMVGDKVKQVAKDVWQREFNNIPMIRINGLNYPMTAVSTKTADDGRTEYKVATNLVIPEESGVLELVADKVQLSVSGYYNMTKVETFNVEAKSIKIDVLRDVPSIQNLKITDDYDAGEATLDFDLVLDKNASQDDEDDFKDGKVVLGGQTKDIEVGHNEVTLKDFEKDKNLDLVFSGSYDLDTDSISETDDKNTYTGATIYQVSYGLYREEDYNGIGVVNGQAVSENGNNYFEKNEKIRLTFGISGVDEKLEAEPLKVVIDGKEYDLVKTDNGFEVSLDGYNTFGEKEIVVSEIVLSNGKVVELSKPTVFKPEVLKDTPKVDGFDFEEETDDQVRVSSKLIDGDKAIVGNAKMIIKAENGTVVYDGEYKEEVTFEKEREEKRYDVLVLADYDRDIDIDDKNNFYEDAILLDELISFEKSFIELKDIVDIKLFKYATGFFGYEEYESVDEIKVEELKRDLDKYFVEISMVNQPTARAEIVEVIDGSGEERGVNEGDNVLELRLEYKYTTKEGDETTEQIKVKYGSIKDGTATNEVHPVTAFNALVDKLMKGEDVVLDQDYDAKDALKEDSSKDYYIESYDGKLNGNGHTIRNLRDPLFGKITGEISNLKLDNVKVSESGNGALANTSEDATINNVAVNAVAKPNSRKDGNGGLIGTANSTTIKNSRVTNASINGESRLRNGLLVGSMSDSKVENSYATGSVAGSANTAGFVGSAQSSEFTNNYVKVETGGSGFANSTGSSHYTNNIAITSGKSSQFMNENSSDVLSNNYYLREADEIVEVAPNECNPSEGDENGDGALEECEQTEEEDEDSVPEEDVVEEETMQGVNNITKDEVNDELFANKAGFSGSVWSIEGVSYDNTPILLAEKTTSFKTENEDYDETKTVLYKNLLKLMPFYSLDKIIELSKVVSDPMLSNVELSHVVPVDAEGRLVTYLTSDAARKIGKIKLIYSDGKKAEYPVSFDKVYDMVAVYKIPELRIDYNYDHYVINASSQLVNNLTNYLKGLNYTNNLDILTSGNDSRIYRDFYNSTTKNELREFVLKYLSNTNYTNTTNAEVINNYIEKEVKLNRKIEKALYVYNYFRRFYDLDIDGIKLYDFMMFNMEGFDSSLKMEKMVDLFLDAKGENFNTAETNTRYNNVLSNYTKLTNVSKFLEYLVTGLSNDKMDEWTRKQFKGILVEVPVDHHPEVQYTLWDHLSNEDANYSGRNYAVHNYVLPILTLPETAGYIISAPAQFTIGAQRVYMGNPENAAEQEKFKAKMQVYVERMKSYYNTLFAILEDANLFNNMHLYQIDRRTTKNTNGNSVYNHPYSTEEPFHKNFDEVINMWPAQYGVNAGNWGNRIEWNVAAFMDSDIKNDGNLDAGHPTWATWSHESAHYFDGRLFLKNYGRRFDAGGEDYADEMFMQKFGNGVVMNLSINYKEGSEISSNLTPERINSKAEIQDFYSKMYESLYTVDYIEAMAFLELTPAQQKAVATQVSYPNWDQEKDGEYNYRAGETTAYSPLWPTEGEEKEYKFNSINDLIDNKIMIYPGAYVYSTRGNNKYGGEGIDIAHWYQPNNPYGRPDSYSLKWFSYEMLGYKGYDDGFVEYASNIGATEKEVFQSLEEKDPAKLKTINNYKSDNMAIEKISGGTYHNIDEYKKARFGETAKNLPHLKYVNVKDSIKRMYEALAKEADEIIKVYTEKVGAKFEKWDQCKDNNGCRNALSNAHSFTESAKIRKEIYYQLKNGSSDFIGDIYDFSANQDVEFSAKDD